MAIEPDNLNAMIMKANTLAARDRKYEKAMSLIKKVLSIVPDDSRAILVEGFILFKSNKYDVHCLGLIIYYRETNSILMLGMQGSCKDCRERLR